MQPVIAEVVRAVAGRAASTPGLKSTRWYTGYVRYVGSKERSDAGLLLYKKDDQRQQVPRTRRTRRTDACLSDPSTSAFLGRFSRGRCPLVEDDLGS